MTLNSGQKRLDWRKGYPRRWNCWGLVVGYGCGRCGGGWLGGWEREECRALLNSGRTVGWIPVPGLGSRSRSSNHLGFAKWKVRGGHNAEVATLGVWIWGGVWTADTFESS